MLLILAPFIFCREAQQRRERILNKLTATQQEQASNEEQRIARALAEWDARQAQLQLEEERKKSEMLKSIAAHRELLVTFTVQFIMLNKMAA